MLKIHSWTLISMLLIGIGSVHSQTCNSTAIVSDLNTCAQQYGDPNSFLHLHRVCENVECSLQCVSDAVGNCYTNAEFLLYNISRLKVTTRAVCSNLPYYYDGSLNPYCSVYNMTCFVEQNITGLLGFFTINATTNPTQYKDAFCQFNTAALTCIDVQPNNDNCTTARIDFLKDFYTTLHSYEECGQSETHPYFTTYSGALNCTATNSSNMTTPSNTAVDPSSTTSESTSQYSLTSAPISSSIESSSQSSTMSNSTFSTTESSSHSSAMFNSTLDDGMYDNDCSFFNDTCLEEQNITGLVIEFLFTNATTNLAQYTDAFCRLNTAFLTCIDVQPNNDNCTTEFNDSFNSIYSYDECCQSETNSYFTTYPGIFNCTSTNSSNHIIPSNTTVYPSSTTTELTSQSSSTSAPSFSTMAPSSQSSVMSSSTSSTMESSSLNSAMPSSTSSTMESSTQSSAMPSSTSSTMESSLQSSAMPSSTSSTMESSTQSSAMSSSTSSTMESPSQSSAMSSLTSSTIESSSQSSTMSDSTLSSAQSTTQRPNQKCSWQQVKSNLGSCNTISADQFSSSYEDILTSFCENVECHVRCFTDAVGDCYLEDQAFFYDPVVYKVVMRAYCNNIKATINAFTLCVMDDTTCIQTYLSSLSSIQTSAQTSNDYAKFANDYCSASSTYDSCVTFTPGGNCSSSYALLMKYTQTVSVSYEKCSQQNHGYFFTYGSEVACGGCSITPHFLLLFVAILSLWQLNN